MLSLCLISFTTSCFQLHQYFIPGSVYRSRSGSHALEVSYSRLTATVCALLVKMIISEAAE